MGYTESSGIKISAKRIAVVEGIGLLTATTVVAEVFDDKCVPRRPAVCGAAIAALDPAHRLSEDIPISRRGQCAPEPRSLDDSVGYNADIQRRGCHRIGAEKNL